MSNDFPPKIGGIQSYLWELWRRLPPEETFVHTTPYRGAEAFDAEQDFWISRSRDPVLLPLPHVARRINRLADELDIDLIILDPAVPLGALARRLERPYALVLHGAEVTIPGRLPASSQILRSVLTGARLVISAGQYAAAEAERCAGGPLRVVNIPPGVDVDRFHPLDEAERQRARARFGLSADDLVVTSISRLVPRKGMDVLIRASARLQVEFPALHVVIAGKGRDRERLGRLVASTGAPVEFVGFVPDRELRQFYGMSDVFAMLCRSRWRGLEQEGFGIVFLEAAACGVPQVCGRSGGAAEATEHGYSGIVVNDPSSVDAVCEGLRSLLSDGERRANYGERGRRRVQRSFTYGLLADRLRSALHDSVEAPGTTR